MKHELASSTRITPGTPRVHTRGAAGTLLLSRSDVERLLTPDECIVAVEDAFRQHALGKTPATACVLFSLINPRSPAAIAVMKAKGMQPD